MVHNAVDAKHVSMTFGGVQVLHSVDLSIAPGEVLGLVGENGSGKSALVKILSGLYTPDRGTGKVSTGDGRRAAGGGRRAASESAEGLVC